MYSQPLPLHPSYLQLVRNIVEAFEVLFHLGCEERGNQEWMVVVVVVCETEITESMGGMLPVCCLNKPVTAILQRKYSAHAHGTEESCGDREA